VVIVLANFLSSATGEDLSQRVQNGKDVLTTLIGVFGAILGFYFGALEDQAGRQGGAPPTPTEEQGFLQPTPPYRWDCVPTVAWHVRGAQAGRGWFLRSLPAMAPAADPPVPPPLPRPLIGLRD
jgi:hypothetical protein